MLKSGGDRDFLDPLVLKANKLLTKKKLILEKALLMIQKRSINFINPFHATSLFLYLLINIRKPYGIERDQGFGRENFPFKSVKETEGIERDQGY